MAADDNGAVAVWHVTAWFEGLPPDRHVHMRVEYTPDVAGGPPVREHHESIESATASLQHFLGELARCSAR